MIELELSAIWFAVQKSSFFLRGMSKFEVITDHGPLLGIFEKPLASLNNTRLRRLRENLNQFSFGVTWSAGKNHLIADVPYKMLHQFCMNRRKLGTLFGIAK